MARNHEARRLSVGVSSIARLRPRHDIGGSANAGASGARLRCACRRPASGNRPRSGETWQWRGPSKQSLLGAAFGVKSYFRSSADWELVSLVPRPKANVLERYIFKHRNGQVYLVADAYEGSRIREAVMDFFSAAQEYSEQHDEPFVHHEISLDSNFCSSPLKRRNGLRPHPDPSRYRRRIRALSSLCEELDCCE